VRFAPVAAIVVLAAAGMAAGAGTFLPVGERAPLPTVKEVVNAKSFSTAQFDGKVVLYDIFRTW
jgi:hypothetical protein